MDNTVEVQELGKVMITPKGEYSLSKSYEILDAVSYNGSSYVSKINDNTSVPTSDAWQLLAQKGDTYELSEEDLQRIAEQITSNANSAFNQNVKEKTDGFNSNANSKIEAYNTNATEKLGTYNSNHTAKLKEYNDNATSKLSAYNTNTVTKTTEYNSNHTNKLNAYNTNADSKIEEYNTNANNKILEYDKHSEELRNMAISTDNELERVKNEILDTGSASDSFVHVEDSCMAKIKELEIEGVFEQETTIGKNLLNVPKNLQQIKSNSYSITPVYSNGMLKYIELKGTFDKWVKYSILGAEFTLSSGTYIQSFHKTGTFSNGSVYIDSDLLITSIESDNYLKVLSDDLNILKYNICVNEGTICNNLKLYPMLAKEGKASNYEPFTNGASPNPDYPQEIKTITDSLKVTSCSKNVFNFNESTKIKYYNCDYKYENDILELTQTSQWTYVSCDIKVKPNTTYVYSFEMDFEGINRPSNWWLSLNDTKGTIYNKNLISFRNDKIYKIFNTTNSNTLQILFTGSTTTIPTKTIFKNIQLEENPNLTDFEQNLLSKIEAKLPEGEFIGKFDDTYKDIVRPKYFPEEGQYHWMLDKMVGHKTFTGNEKWIYYANAKIFYFDRVDSPIKTFYPIATHYIGGTYNTNNRILIDNNGRVHISDYRYSNIADFKKFLSNNNIEMYYPLKTPYTIDLGPIDMPLSYKKITNVFTDSDLLPTINVKYYRTFEKTVQNLQINEKSLKQEIADLNVNLADITKRLEALESANASIVEESEVSNDLQN